MGVMGHWTFDPFVVLAAVAAVAHELGLRRLMARAAPARARRRRRRSFLFYGGLVVLVAAVASPVNYWAYRYFYVHMIEHVLLMFISPMLLVAGAPWIPLAFAVPVGLRRRIGRAVALDPRTVLLRRTWRFVSAPWTALLVFNFLMVFWHVPGPFDLAQRTLAVYVWLMHGSFVVSGLLFWLQIIPSRPFHRRASTMWQMGAIISSNVAMFILAMAMSIFTSTSWYDVYAHVPGVTLSPFADQQIGAAILWVCGDFWAIPSLVMVIRRAVEQEGSFSEVVEAMLVRRRGAAVASGNGLASGNGAAIAGGLVPFDAQLRQENDKS
jgi:putative membrane protein